MKTSILTIVIAAFFVACNPKPAVETVSVKQNTTDTSGFSEFQIWKDQKDLIAEQSESFTTDAVVEESNAKPTNPKATLTTNNNTCEIKGDFSFPKKSFCNKL